MVELGSFEVEQDEQEERGVVAAVAVSWEWVEDAGKK